MGSAASCRTPSAPPLAPVGGQSARLALAPLPQPTVRLAAMTAEEMKAAENGAQPAPLPLEGVDISPKQDEGVLKVRGPRRPRLQARGPPGGRRCAAAGGWGAFALPGRAAALKVARWLHAPGGCGPRSGRSPHCNANSIRLHCAAERGGAERESRSRGPGRGA